MGHKKTSQICSSQTTEPQATKDNATNKNLIFLSYIFNCSSFFLYYSNKVGIKHFKVMQTYKAYKVSCSTITSLLQVPYLTMIKILVLFFGYLALTSAGRVSRIRNGRPVSQGELERSFPFVAYALNCGRGGMCSACTGSLVSANTVLLSSHCFCGGGGNINVRSS